jgi:hypothetical protein
MTEQQSSSSPHFTIYTIFREYFIVLLAPFLLLAPVLFTGQALFWGTPALQFVPWWWEAWEQVRQGILPLWNPLNGMGAPLLANYQMAFFYPPNWLLLPLAALAGPAGIAWGYTWLAAIHLAWAGLGMAFLLRQMRFGWLAQVMGGMAFGLSGYLVGRLGFFSMTWVASWLPWMLFFIEKRFSMSEIRAQKFHLGLPFGLSICVAMQLLAGHAQLAWYSLLLAGTWTVVGLWRMGLWRRAFSLLLGAGLAVVLGAVTAAVQLVTTFEYLSVSQRSNTVQYDEVMRYSLWPWRAITIFSPDFFGNPGDGTFWGYASYWEDHIYAGMVPLLLALATLVLVGKGILRREKRTDHWKISLFVWILMFVTLVLALGQNTPVFPFLYHFIPSFDMFQAPARYLIWMAVGLPVLAAVGIEHWRCPTGKGLYWFRLGTAGAFAITLGAGLTWLTQEGIRLTFIRSTALTGIWGLGFGLLTLVIPLVEKRGYQKYWRASVIAWTLFDLLAAGWLLNPGTDLSFYDSIPGLQMSIQQPEREGRQFMLEREEYELKFSRFLRFKDFRPLEDWRFLRYTRVPNLNLLDGTASVNNFDPLIPARYARWMAELENRSPGELKSWMEMMGVSTIIKIDAREAVGVRLDPVDEGSRWRWYSCIQAVESEEDAWQAIQEHLSRIPSSQQPLVIEGWQGGQEASCSQPAAEMIVVEEKANQVQLRIRAPSEGWVFQADTWYPGWSARLNGKPIPLYRANYLFRAVHAPAGESILEIYYTPRGFYLGCLFSILGLFVLFVILFKNKGI